MSDTDTELLTEQVSPKERQAAAVAVLSTPILQRMGVRPGRETRARASVAEACATIERLTLSEWVTANYSARGVRS